MNDDSSVTERLPCGCIRYIWTDEDGTLIRTDFCKKHEKEDSK